MLGATTTLAEFPGVQPNRITLSASDCNETLAAIPVGLDSLPGLFVDKRYRDEGDSIRARKRKACNFTKLALATGVRAKLARAALFRIAYIYERRINHCTDLVVEVNPRCVAIVDALRQAS